MADWKRLGHKETPSGAILIGHCPHVAPEAWLHIRFAPLNLDGMQTLRGKLTESGLSCEIPKGYQTFLSLSNGLSLFSGSLALYGLRTSWERTGEDCRHPFDLASHANEHLHSFQRSDTIPDADRFFIGAYRSDGSAVYIERPSGAVRHVRRGTDSVSHSWDSFDAFLRTEIERLSMHFDDTGTRIDTSRSTAPV